MPRRWLSVLMLAMITIGAPSLSMAKPPLEIAVKRQQLRDRYTRFESVIEALKINEGMTILDLGAGPGQASFLLAAELKGSGRVVATDIRGDFVDYINQQARERGLSNLSAMRVAEEGLDDFYQQQHYDLVFLSNVYHAMADRVNFFTRLRTYLNPGARLVLIMYNQAPLFSQDDFIDLDGMIDTLTAETNHNPFYTRLSSGTHLLLAASRPTEELVAALVSDFNRLLLDPRFYENFYQSSYFEKELFTAAERDLANWLLMSLKEAGMLEPRSATGDPKSRLVIKLNRLFFQKKLGSYLANSGRGAYIPAGDANRHTSKYEMLRELRTAGYEFVNEISVSPFFDAVIMVPGQ